MKLNTQQIVCLHTPVRQMVREGLVKNESQSCNPIALCAKRIRGLVCRHLSKLKVANLHFMTWVYSQLPMS